MKHAQGAHGDGGGRAELQQVCPRHIWVLVLDVCDQLDGRVQARIWGRCNLLLIANGASGATSLQVFIVGARVVPCCRQALEWSASKFCSRLLLVQHAAAKRATSRPSLRKCRAVNLLVPTYELAALTNEARRQRCRRKTRKNYLRS